MTTLHFPVFHPEQVKANKATYTIARKTGIGECDPIQTFVF